MILSPQAKLIYNNKINYLLEKEMRTHTLYTRCEFLSNILLIKVLGALKTKSEAY